MHPIKELKNILIVRTDRIGDVVLTTPAIEALRKGFPQARITLLVSPLTYELVEGNPNVDEILIDDREGAHKGFFGFWKLVFMLRARKFDCAIIFHTKKRTNMLCFHTGIPRRVGYRNEKFGFLLTHPLKDLRNQGIKHESEYCLDVVRSLGIANAGGKVYIPIKKANEEWAEKFLLQNGIAGKGRIVAVHPGASGPEKSWPFGNFIEVVKCFIEKHKACVILVGGYGATVPAAEIKAKFNHSVWNLAGKTSVGQLVSLLKRCSFLVSNDSGPVHVADAVGTPVISVFIRNSPGINPERWRPLGNKNIIIAPPRTETGAPAAPIPTERILEAVDALFKLC